MWQPWLVIRVVRYITLPRISLVDVALSLLIFVSLTPLLGPVSRYSFIVILCFFLNKCRISRRSIIFKMEFLLPFILLFILSLAVIPIYGLPVNYWVFLLTFILIIFLSISVLDAIGLDKILKVNFYFVSGLTLLSMPIFILYRLGIIDAGTFLSYQYGPYISKTIIFLNIHQYLDGTYSGRFVGFGSEPGLTQVSWLLGLYYGLKKKLNRSLVLSLVAAIILGRSPIGVIFATFILTSYFINNWQLYVFLTLSVFITAVLSLDLLFLIDNLGLIKLTESYFSLRFERDIIIFHEYMDYIFPGGIYQKYNVLIMDDFLGFGGVSQLIQRFGLFFSISFLLLVLAKRMSLKNGTIVVFLFASLATQSLFLNPLFYLFWYGVLYYEIGLFRVPRI